MNSNNKVLEMHSLALGYNESLLRTPLLSIERYIKKIEYFIDIKPKQIIIDLGCGDGAITKKLAENYPDCFFIGIDYSKDLIKYAQDNNLASNIKYITANLIYDEVDLVEKSVDCIFSWGVIYYLNPCSDFNNFHNNILKLLKTGGKICHFQIPLRYRSIFYDPEIIGFNYRKVFTNLKINLIDFFSAKYSKFSYKYSKNNLLRFKQNFQNTKIIQDDYFIDRVSVIYDGKC